MKKLLIYILIFALLCGCAPIVQEAETKPETEPTETQQTETLSPAVTDTGYFSRTEIIRRNEHEEGIFLNTKQWAAEYAAQTWPDSEYTVDFLSGFEAPSAMFTDALCGGSAFWTVTVSQTGGQALIETIQTLYFTDNGQIYLTGLLTGDAVLEARPEVYTYLRLDTRFSARMCDLPAVNPPEGLIGTYDLDQLFDAEGCSAELLDKSTVVLHDLNWTTEDGSHRLEVVDLNTKEKLAEETLESGNGSWQITDCSDGTATFTHYVNGGRDRVLYASRAGIEEKELYPEAAYRWPMGTDRFVESSENSLFLIVRDPATGVETRTLLLQGVNAKDDTAAAFTFRKALSEDQFVYDYWGYEWYNRSGVYDLSSGTDFVITVPVTENGISRQAQTRMLSVDLTTAVTALDDYGYYCFAVTDRTSNTTRLLELGHENAETRVSEAHADGTRLLLMGDSGDEAGSYSFELYDLNGSLLWNWAQPSAISGSIAVSLADAHTIGVQFFSLATGTTQLYVVSVS